MWELRNRFPVPPFSNGEPEPGPGTGSRRKNIQQSRDWFPCTGNQFGHLDRVTAMVIKAPLPDRRALIGVPVAEVLAVLTSAPRAACVITIAAWQPLDALHRAAYDRGFYVLELDDHEQPVGAYRNAAAWEDGDA